MIISEQPGRIVAILIVGPFLVYKGVTFNDITLYGLGILFILYEVFWVLYYEPKRVIL